MAARMDARILFDALTLEGGLLPPEWLTKVAALDAPLQKPADYGVPKGLELRDEITRYWRMAEALYADFAKQREHAKDDGERATDRFVSALLVQVFGFTGLAAGSHRELQGRGFTIGYESSDGLVPVVVGVAGDGLDTPTARHGEGGRRRSAWGSLQEYLNASDDSLWGIASNGVRLRIGRDNTSLTRPAWIEADLERIFDEDRFADFSVLWLIVHATRFAGEPSECSLERWRDAAREAGTRAREQLRDGVEAALLALGQGFLSEPSNAALRQALATGDLTPAEYFNELLRLVYRMIFLVTVEERGILHDDNVAPERRALYADGYAIRRLVDRSIRRSQRDRHHDKWSALRPVFAGLGRAGGEPQLGLPELGGLFAPAQCVHLDASDLGNRALLESVFRLGWLRQSSGLSRVNWKDMGPEELGSIYESLLELVPRISDDGRSFTFAGRDESAGNERKLTGSYYTPDSLVQQLLDTALEPVIDARLAADDDAERALLSITVIDPACGSGHFLLAAARRLATRLASVRTGGTPGAHEYRLALRDVVTHCIHGVDRNPMALELARMSLWLETYTPDRALGFLDHHLVQGDALLGLLDLGVLRNGIPDDAFKALTGDDKAVAKTLAKLNRAALKQLEKRKHSKQMEAALRYPELSDGFAGLDELGDDSIESVEAKRQRFEALRASAADSAAALAADLFLGAFLMPKRLGPGEKLLTDSAAAGRFSTTGTLLMALEGALPPDHTVATAARAACRAASVLHWPLAFPQVFARGGFDAVVGNPPWGAAVDVPAGALVGLKTAVGQFDTAFLFLERGLTLVAGSRAVGFVLPDSMLVNEDQRPIREILSVSHTLVEVIKLGEGVFEDVFRGSILLTAQRGAPPAGHQFRGLVVQKADRRSGHLLRDLLATRGVSCSQDSMRARKAATISLAATGPHEQLMLKIEAQPIEWGALVERGRGIELNSDAFVVQCPSCRTWSPPPVKRKGVFQSKECSACGAVFAMGEAAAQTSLVADQGVYPTAYIDGSDFDRYRIRKVKSIDTSKQGIDYKAAALYQSPKILFRQTGIGVTATLDSNLNAYVPQSVYLLSLASAAQTLGYQHEYLLGVLNSRLMTYYVLTQTGQSEWQSFPRWTMGRVFQLPVRRIDWCSTREVELHGDICRLVRRILSSYDRSTDLELEGKVRELYEISTVECELMHETLTNVEGVAAVTRLLE